MPRSIIPFLTYHNDPVFGQIGPGKQSRPLEEQSDQGLHCLPIRLHVLDILLYVKTIMAHFSNFRIITAFFVGVSEFLGLLRKYMYLLSFISVHSSHHLYMA